MTDLASWPNQQLIAQLTIPGYSQSRHKTETKFMQTPDTPHNQIKLQTPADDARCGGVLRAKLEKNTEFQWIPGNPHEIPAFPTKVSP
jgi:hypothetical protein